MLLASIAAVCQVLGGTPPEDLNVIGTLVVGGETPGAFKEGLAQIARYFERVSYGQCTLEFALDVAESRAEEMPGVLAREDAPRIERTAFVDALLQALGAATWSRYARVLIVVPDPVWPYTVKRPLPEAPLRAVAIVSSRAEWPTIAHEVGHLLGLPDLYDTTKSAVGTAAAVSLGPWCLMSRSTARPGLCGWSRLQLNWLRAEHVRTVEPGTEDTVCLDALEGPAGHHLIAKVNISKHRYYLAEVRRQVGLDSCLPMEGVVITRVSAFEERPYDRVRIVDAAPSTATLSDAAFQESMVFEDPLHAIRIEVIKDYGSALVVRVRNGVSAEE